MKNNMPSTYYIIKLNKVAPVDDRKVVTYPSVNGRKTVRV